MSEAALERYLVRKIREQGGECIKLTGVRGIPDRLVLLPQGQAIFVELKNPDGSGRLSKMQKHWIKRLKDLGFAVEVVACREQVGELVKRRENNFIEWH